MLVVLMGLVCIPRLLRCPLVAVGGIELGQPAVLLACDFGGEEGA